MLLCPIRLSYFFCFSSWNFFISYVILFSKVLISKFGGAINTLEQWPCSFLEYTCLECILNICTYSWLLQWYSPLLATNFPILDCHIHLKRNSNVLMDLVPRRKMLCQLCYSNKVLLLWLRSPLDSVSSKEAVEANFSGKITDQCEDLTFLRLILHCTQLGIWLC